MKKYERVIGIDISTERLDIADSSAKIETAIEYTLESVKAKIIKKIKDASNTLIVCEATGGTQLTQLINQESNRISRCADSQAKAFIEEMLKSLKEQLKSVDSVLACLVEAKAKTESKVDVIRSVPGVGPYMAALVATQKNPVIKRFYIRLVSNGKPKKLAIIACMRKLLTMLNDMVRQNKQWDEKWDEKKRAALV